MGRIGENALLFLWDKKGNIRRTPAQFRLRACGEASVKAAETVQFIDIIHILGKAGFEK